MNLPFQPYDFLMLAVLVLSTIFGAWKGMAWQLAALASLVASTLVALRFGSALAPYIDMQEPWNYCVAVLILYVAASLAVWLLFRMVADFIDRVQLREFDRQVGAVFGLAKGVLWCMLITFFAVTLSDAMRARVLRSRSGYYAALLVHRATPLLPIRVRDVLGRYIEEFDRKLEPSHVAEPHLAEPNARKRTPLKSGLGDLYPARSEADVRWASNAALRGADVETSGPAGPELPSYHTPRDGAGGWDLSPDHAAPAEADRPSTDPPR